MLLPSPDQRRVWGFIFNSHLVKCLLKRPKALAVDGWPVTSFWVVFFKTIFPSLALVELQRCKTNRIHSSWKKPVQSAFPFKFLGHLSFCSVQKHLSPLATAFPGNVVTEMVLIAEIIGRPKGPVCCHLLQALCCACHKLWDKFIASG